MAYKFIFSKNERSGFSDVNCHWWRGNEIREHFHLDYYEVIIATKGEHYQILDGTRIKMEPGKCLILSPLTTHRIDESDAMHYNLAVKSALFEKLCANKPQIRSELSLRLSPSGIPGKPIISWFCINFLFTVVMPEKYPALSGLRGKSVLTISER